MIMKRILNLHRGHFILTIVLVCFAQQVPAQTPRENNARTFESFPADVYPNSATGSSKSPSNSAPSNGAAPEQRPPATPSSTLVCRMGGNMVWTLINQFELMQTQINGKNVRVPVVVALFDQLKFFRGGAAQADGAGLQPGYCGWSDRAMTAKDPDTLVADADGFMFNETVQWGNGSTIKGETTMFGGSLSFQNKQVFSMQVTLFNGVMLKVVPGTKPKAISK
jgi:hypothetical protein